MDILCTIFAQMGLYEHMISITELHIVPNLVIDVDRWVGYYNVLNDKTMEILMVVSRGNGTYVDEVLISYFGINMSCYIWEISRNLI